MSTLPPSKKFIGTCSLLFILQHYVKEPSWVKQIFLTFESLVVMKLDRLHGTQVGKAYLEPSQTSKMERFAKVVSG